MNTIEIGDCRDIMRRWLQQGVTAQMCVTSPPYFGLRDYGHPGQIGLEPTPEAYIDAMVEVFRCVRDVLVEDGTLWLNIGDSYASSPASGGKQSSKMSGGEHKRTPAARPYRRPDGFKPKDLIGIPWMLAFALRADGWYLRQDIIWHKPNPMPESVRDRCTKAHEYVFLLTKSPRYYYDADAVSEELSRKPHAPMNKCSKDGGHMRNDFGTDAMQRVWCASGRRNRRSVWTVTPKPYKGAHFAVMPPDLVEPCIKAGCPEGGIVLDPFLGSGTTLAVANSLGRRGLGIELNPEYIELARARIQRAADKAPLFTGQP